MRTGRSEDGRFWADVPGVGPQEITEQEYTALNQSRGARFLSQAGSTLADSAAFAGEMLYKSLPGAGPVTQLYESLSGNQAPTTQIARSIDASNDPQQQARRAVDPTMTTLGDVAAIAGEALLPIPGLKGAGTATRTTAGTSKGQTIAQSVIDQVPPSQGGRVSLYGDDMPVLDPNAPDGSMGAARAGADDVAGFEGTNQALEGFLTPDVADDIGLPLTPGDRMALGAKAGSKQMEQANAIRIQEDLATSGELGSLYNIGDNLKGISATKAAQKDWFTNWLAATLGDPNVTNLTRTARARLRKETSKVFQKYIDNNPDPIQIDQAAADALALNRVVDDPTGRVGQWVDEIVAAKDPGTGSVNPEKFSSLRKGLVSDMENAFKAGNYDLGSALSQLNELLDDALMKTLDGEAQAAISEARLQWRLHKALERRGAKDMGGELNARSFQGAWEAVNPAVKRAARKPDEVTQMIDTLAYLQTKTQPDSGTAQRLLQEIGRTGLGTRGGIGVGLGGGAALLGQ